MINNNSEILHNALSKLINGNEALKLIVDNITDESDVSMYMTIIDIVCGISPIQGLDITMKIIETTGYKEQALCKMISLLRKNPYTLNDTNIKSYRSFLNDVCSNHHMYSNDVLVSLAESLEFLFANGNKSLSSDIAAIYRFLSPNSMLGEEYVIHKQLICAYEYNGLNYNVIWNKLSDIYHKCRISKRKYLFGMVHYYFAVLAVLSGAEDIYNGQTRIDLACEYGYELAYALRNCYVY